MSGSVDGSVLDVMLTLREQATGPRWRPVLRYYLIQAPAVYTHTHTQTADCINVWLGVGYYVIMCKDTLG